MVRKYRSALRDERAIRTRTALLQACEALLLEGPAEAVTLPAVARRAGLTKPTAYGYFPDNDALMAGFVDHLRDRIGMEHETLAGIPPARLPAAVRHNYRRFEQNARLLRPIMDSPSYDRVRLARKVDRAAMVLPAWRRAASAPASVLRLRLAPVYLLLTPACWRWLRETWGLSGDDAARAAAWAMQALVSALATSTPRTSPRDEAAASGRKKRRKPS